MQNPLDVEPPEDNDLFKEANMAVQEPEIMSDDDTETEDGDDAEEEEEDEELHILNRQLHIINEAQRELVRLHRDDSDDTGDDMSDEEETSEEEGDEPCPNAFPQDFLTAEPHPSRTTMGCDSPTCSVCYRQ